MKPINLVIGLLIALAAGSVFIMIIFAGKEVTEKSIGSLIPDMACPQDAKIMDYVTRMRTFAADDSITPEPNYAIEIFKQYLACKNPKKGPSRFTTAELEEYNAEILVCAKHAYLNYKKELEAKKEESANYEEDILYYADLIEELDAEYNTFNAVFPESTYAGKMCNYPATGRTA